ncbi:MAG: hypothetical protein QW102_01960 [Candidatus Nezhaarchaeales archaeon]
MISTILKTVSRGVVGAVTGLIYFFLYAAALPGVFQRIAGLPVDIELPMDFPTILAVFIALGIAENVAPTIPGAAFRVLSKLVGASYLYFALNGGIVSANIANFIVTLDASLLIYIILAGSIVIGVLDAATHACRSFMKE